MNIDLGQRLLGRQVLRDGLQPIPRWLAAVAAGILVFVPVWAYSGQGSTAVLAGWDAAILTCLIVTFFVSRAEGSGKGLAGAPASTSALAAITAAASVGLLGALLLAGRVGRPETSSQAYLVGLAMAAVVASWLIVRLECRLHVARLRHERRRHAGSSHTLVPAAHTTAAPDMETLGFWEFVYYAFPIVKVHDASDPVPVTPEMCRVAVLQSVMTYASIIILASFGLSLIGPGLNGARVVLGG